MKLRSGRSYGGTFPGVGRRLGGGGGFASAVGAVAPYVAKMLGQKLMSRFGSTRTVSGRSAIESSMNTTQHDSRLRYRKKRMPRRRRRAYVGKLKLFRHFMEKEQPLQTYTVKNVNNAASLLNQQITYGICLFTDQVTSESDLLNIFSDAYNLVTPLTTAVNKRLYIKSACLDIQMTNVAANACIIDVYRIRLRNVWNTTDNLFTIWNTTFGDQGTITAKSSSDPAVTPFQNPTFCKYFKVLDKREVLLGAGLTTSFQLRRPGNRLVQGRRVVTEPFGYRGLCEGFLFQQRGVPQTVTAVNQLVPTSVTWAYQKTYTYALPVGADASEAIHDA